MRLKPAALLAAVFLCVPDFAKAEDVRIRSEGGGLELTGRVVGYDGTFLQLDTTYGPLTLRYASVNCTGADCPDAESFVPKVRLSGSARMGEVLLPALIEAYARSTGHRTRTTAVDATHFQIDLVDADDAVKAEFRFRLTNADEGFADLLTFEADVVMSVREVRPDEVTRAAAVGLGTLSDPQQSRIIALDALVPVVHPGLDLRSIALRDLARAYRGMIDNWAQIGGPDLPLSVHLGPVTDGTAQFFDDHVVGLGAGTMTARVVRHATGAALSQAVATMPGSLGVLPFRQTGNTQPLSLKDACGLVATPQTVTLKTEDYPLTEPLFLYLPDRRQPAIIRDFLAWLRGTDAQLVVRRAGFVDQGAIPIPLDSQGQRFANAIAKAGEDIGLAELQRMVQVLTPRTRLSTSFRFEVGSTRLDAQSRSNLLALGQAIRDGRYDGQSLMLVGFSDGRGDAGPNRDLSIARAESVKRALSAALGGLPDAVQVEIEAFGEALPMGCDDTEWGRQMNRRVELWVDQG